MIVVVATQNVTWIIIIILNTNIIELINSYLILIRISVGVYVSVCMCVEYDKMSIVFIVLV